MTLLIAWKILFCYYLCTYDFFDFKFFSRKAGHLFEVADSIDQSSEDLIDESRPESQAIRDFGAEAYYALNNPTRARIEVLSDKAVVDVRHRQLFTSGLGVVIAAGYHFQESYTKFYYRRQLEDLAQSFHDVDIDASLSRLLEGN